MIRCLECGEELHPSLEEYVQAEGDYLCKRCRWTVNGWMAERLVKVIKEEPAVFQKVFVDESLPGLGDFLDAMKELKEEL